MKKFFAFVLVISILDSVHGQQVNIRKEAEKKEEESMKSMDSLLELKKELMALRDSLKNIKNILPDLPAEVARKLNPNVLYDTIVTIRDTVYYGFDEIDVLKTQVKPGFLFKKKFYFPVVAGDTILYTLTKHVPDKKVKYWPRQGGVKSKKMILPETKEEQLIISQTSTDAYGFAFKKGLGINYVDIDIRKLKKWTQTDKLIDTVFKAKPPPEPVYAYDTTSRLVSDQVHYVGAVRNIRAKDRILVELDFSGDPYLSSTDSYLVYLVGFGKGYESDLNSLEDAKTQLPLSEVFGDPLTAFFAGSFADFPPSRPRNIRLRLSRGRQVIRRNFRQTVVDAIGRERTTYTLSIDNPDEVAGEYIYVKVMAIDVTQTLVE